MDTHFRLTGDDSRKSQEVLEEPQSPPPGTIVIPAQHAAKYTNFYMSLLATKMPEGSFITMSLGSGIAENRNKSIQEMQGEWIWFLDDDHVWQPNLLLKLLEHQVDIITPLVLRKQYPFPPVCFDRIDENGNYESFHFLGKDPGLYKMVAVGAAGMLIQKYVLDDMKYPWFEMGKLVANETSEDLYFCQKARRLGYDVYVDTSLPMAHTHLYSVRAIHHEGKWLNEIDLGNTYQIYQEYPKDNK